MEEKVILILVDAMRPDSLEVCGHPFIDKFTSESITILDAETEVPSVTLPCHLSLFYSLPPQMHGILSNTFVPQVRKTDGLFEQLHKAGKRAAAFHSWEKLRDISHTNTLAYSYFLSKSYGVVKSVLTIDHVLTDKALRLIKDKSPDFVFLKLSEPDAAGHVYGHMTEGYLKAVYNSWELIEKVYNELSESHSIIVTADHGGHDRTHGTNMPEDTTIPIILRTPIKTIKKTNKAKLIDITPTIATLMGIDKSIDWEGTSLL